MKIFNKSIVCKPVKEENQDPAGLIIPKQKNYKILKVIDFDPTIQGIEKGDILYVMLNAPFEVDVEGETYEVVKIDHVIMIP